MYINCLKSGKSVNILMPESPVLTITTTTLKVNLRYATLQSVVLATTYCGGSQHISLFCNLNVTLVAVADPGGLLFDSLFGLKCVVLGVQSKQWC